MSATEQEYKNHIKELEQQVRLLKEQVDFLTRTWTGKTVNFTDFTKNYSAIHETDARNSHKYRVCELPVRIRTRI